MCLIAFAFDTHPDFKLILVANRDEFYERPTQVAHFWEEDPQILGGRDEKAGGTWMAISKNGRFSAVTNYRDLKNIREDARSRGELPINFLKKNRSSRDYLTEVHTAAQAYNGFNVLTWADNQMGHYSNYEYKINILEPGIYGLSNALLDTSWPKVKKLKGKFQETIQSAFSHQDLLALLTDDSLAPENELPDTGIGKDWEKMLSPINIQSENYGTCCSTILTISRNGQVEFTEKTYPVGNRKEGQVSFRFQL